MKHEPRQMWLLSACATDGTGETDLQPMLMVGTEDEAVGRLLYEIKCEATANRGLIDSATETADSLKRYEDEYIGYVYYADTIMTTTWNLRPMSSLPIITYGEESD